MFEIGDIVCIKSGHVITLVSHVVHTTDLQSQNALLTLHSYDPTTFADGTKFIYNGVKERGIPAQTWHMLYTIDGIEYMCRDYHICNFESVI